MRRFDRSFLLASILTAASTVALLTPPARADDTGVRKSLAVEPRFGAFLPIGRLETGAQGGVLVGYALPLHIGPGHILGMVDIGFSAPTYTATGTDPQVGGNYAAAVREHELTTAVLAAYALPLSHGLGLVAGAGPLVYFLSAREGAFGGTANEHETRTGALIDAALTYHLGPGHLALTLGAELGTTDQLLTGSAGLHGLAASLGYVIPIF